MIKALLRTEAGATMVVLGLSDKNLEKLRAKKPIMVRGSEIGMDGTDVMIVWGPTEAAIYGDFKALIGPQTKVVGTPSAER